MKILVLGGAGFIGRHAVAALKRRGHEVTVGSRFAQSKTGSAQLQVQFHKTLSDAHWAQLIDGFDAVLNCVGILRQRVGETYSDVHCHSPAALARACASKSIRVVHISALGLSHAASSRFLRSKREGEQAVAHSGADYTIVRPSLLDGADGFGAAWLRRVANWPIHLVPADARGRIAALDVDDLGDALARLCELRDAAAFREVELGGQSQFTLAKLLAALRTKPGSARVLRIPALIVRAAAHVLDLLHLTPLSWGHVELMRRDNCPSPTHTQLAALLGREPRLIDRGAAALDRPRCSRAGAPAPVAHKGARAQKRSRCICVEAFLVCFLYSTPLFTTKIIAFNAADTPQPTGLSCQLTRQKTPSLIQ